MFTQKKIKLNIQLQNGKFGGNTNTVTIEDLPIQVSVKRAGLPAMDEAKITILGLSRELMDSLTFLSYRNLLVNANKIDIYAGDNTGLDLVFSGEITSAIPNFQSAPSVSMELEAITGYSSIVKAEPPFSVKGSIPVSNLCEQIAKQAGFTFVNKGVNKIANNVHLKGGAITKLRSLQKDYGIGMTIENNVVTIYPQNQKGNLVLTVSNDNGLIGYPSFTQDGIKVKFEFAPQVSIGTVIKVDSVVPKASGEWSVFSLSHNISANIPNGAWETEIDACFGVFL